MRETGQTRSLRETLSSQSGGVGRELAEFFRALDLSEALVQFPASTDGYIAMATPQTSSGLGEHQTHTWYTCIYAVKTYT